jgi:hypothetical protein
MEAERLAKERVVYKAGLKGGKIMANHWRRFLWR